MRTHCKDCGCELKDKNAREVGQCLGCYAIDNSDFDEDEEIEVKEPDYYECLCCGHSQTNKPTFGGQCPKCSAHMEEGYF